MPRICCLFSCWISSRSRHAELVCTITQIYVSQTFASWWAFLHITDRKLLNRVIQSQQAVYQQNATAAACKQWNTQTRQLRQLYTIKKNIANVSPHESKTIKTLHDCEMTYFLYCPEKFGLSNSEKSAMIYNRSLVTKQATRMRS